jgi:hypothetical protein
LDLDEVSSEKKRLAEALALEARETRDARDEAERLARQLADERESSRRRLREARAVADAKEAKHRLEQAEWEDAARLKRRERYAGETRASFSAGGPDRDPTGRDPTGRDPTVPRARTGEGADGGGDGGGDGDAHVGGGDDDDDGGEFAIHALGGPFVAADELASELPVHIDASGDPAVYPQFVNAVVHAVASLNITNAVVRAPSSHPVTSALKSVAPLNMYAMFVTAAVFHPDMF